jgi:hypothetical protein
MNNKEQKVETSTEPAIVGNTVLPAVYPLIDNHRWYAENGTVYNSEDETVKIVLLHENGSYSNLPNEIANMIASALNSR